VNLCSEQQDESVNACLDGFWVARFGLGLEKIGEDERRRGTGGGRKRNGRKE